MTKRKCSLLFGAAGVACLSGPAWAQSAPAAQGFEATDIVVTAQRREQRLQDVPLAVSAVGEEALSQANITSAIDIGKVVPSAVIQTNNATVTAFIRGMGNSQTAVGNEASNALYIDGVYFARITAASLMLNNVDRVEVLKGPQGTLFGRNSTSGLIQIITRTPRPGDSPEARIGLGYGKYDSVEANAYLSTGLGQKAAIDISAAYRNQMDGFGANVFDGSERLKTKEYAFRSKLVVEPDDMTQIIVEGDYARSISDMGISQIYRIPGATTSNPQGATGNPDGNGLAPLYGFYDSSQDFPSISNIKEYGGYLRVSRELSFATLVNTLAYHQSTGRFALDVDMTSQLYSNFDVDSYSKQLSNELQLVSQPGSPIEWTVGAYYFRHRYGYDPGLAYGPIFGAGPTGGIANYAFGRARSFAVYGQTTIPLNDVLRLTLGGRYTQDRLHSGGKVDFFVGDTVVAPGVPASGTVKAKKATWKAVLDYKPSDEVLLYGSVSRGYKSGIFNIFVFEPDAVKPEVLDAFELGFKSELWDRRAHLNIAAFYYKQHDPQVVTVPRPGTNALLNAGGARVLGLEIEGDVRPTDRLSIRGGLTVLDSKYTDFANAPFYLPNPAPPYGNFNPVPGDATGNDLSRAPRFSAVIGATYTMPVAWGEVALSANYNYVGKFYWDPDLVNSGGKYGLLDAQIALSLPDDKLKISVWGSNLTGEKYFISEYSQALQTGYAGAVGEPRRYGIRLEYRY